VVGLGHIRGFSLCAESLCLQVELRGKTPVKLQSEVAENKSE